MDAVLVPLTRSPRLPDYVRELSALLQQEAAERCRFRDWLDEDKKAEFINGEIVVHSPAKLEHTEAQKLILKLLDTFVAVHQLGKVLHEKALIELTRNDYEPDICFWKPKKASRFTGKQMVFPPADFIIEVLSPSTEQVDRGVKFEDYAAHDTAEYWLVDPVRRVIEQYRLAGNAFALHATCDATSTIESIVVTGFRMPVVAAFDSAANLTALRSILAQ